MQFALHFANLIFPDPERAELVAKTAEQVGFESMFCIEHVVVPTDYTSVYPYAPDGKLPGGPGIVLPDPLIWMTYAAAVTRTIRFMTGVMILPQRNPLVLAKEVATLDYLSKGRVELGIGVGWLREEFDALGVPFEGRGKRADEYIHAMRALWTSDDAAYSGSTVQFQGINSNPKPVHGQVPIIVGGHSHAAARRAGRLGDGYFPAIGRQVDLPELFDVAKAAAVEHGRDPNTLAFYAGCPDIFGEDPTGAVAERQAMGVTKIAIPGAQFADDPVRQIEAFAERVLRHYT